MEEENIADKIKEYRHKVGFSQNQLASESGLNLRTIQRIENGETVPRGDSLRRLAIAFGSSPDELINWKTKEDKNVLTILNLSQLLFIAFPILGILVPFIIWILEKENVKGVDETGKSILNFQITWSLVFFSFSGIGVFFRIGLLPIGISTSHWLALVLVLYIYNIFIIILNMILSANQKKQFYKPALRILN